MQIPDKLYDTVSKQPYPLLFATISGAHLYGFASPDSDWDLRGVHILPARLMLGLDVDSETITVSQPRDSNGLELDLVTHDIRKFFLMLLRKNGYVLEQLYSPLVVHTTPEHEYLKDIAKGCITRYHVHHYLGFADTQWKLFKKDSPGRVKPLLYTFRVLLTGIYLMRTGVIEANLHNLNEEIRLPYIDDLISRKVTGEEQSVLEDSDLSMFEFEYNRLRKELQISSDNSHLPERSSSREALNDLLIHVRTSLL